ncbi:trypsin-like cysteine/serine peptidase domain-containing protein [Nemania sp. FL0031]|nr:trypsin-like cysteine/serine peptidase domain-containing protein [Nemania sp. FL0031]
MSRPPIDRPQQYHDMALVRLVQGGFLDVPSLDYARRLLSSRDDGILGETVLARGFGPDFEYRDREELEAFLYRVGVLVSQRTPLDGAISTASTLIHQRGSNGTMHVQTGEGLMTTGYQVAVFAPLQSQRVDGHEAILRDKDSRSVSRESDVRDSGSYSGVVIVKAFFKETGVYTCGTAVLIDDRHAVTVAHNVWHVEDGPARAITLCRDERVDVDGTGCYRVEVVGVHCRWANMHSKANDFALLRIYDRVSDGIKPMRYKQTPIDGCAIAATVYGFTSRLPESRSDLIRLAQSQGSAKYNIEEAMVDHTGDTIRGASGGPLVDSDGSIIAIHRGWRYLSDESTKINQAVAINRHDNNVEGFIRAVAGHQATNNVSGVVRGRTDEFESIQVTLFGWNQESEPYEENEVPKGKNRE